MSIKSINDDAEKKTFLNMSTFFLNVSIVRSLNLRMSILKIFRDKWFLSFAHFVNRHKFVKNVDRLFNLLTKIDFFLFFEWFSAFDSSAKPETTDKISFWLMRLTLTDETDTDWRDWHWLTRLTLTDETDTRWEK
jgi:hypothetical protein